MLKVGDLVNIYLDYFDDEHLQCNRTTYVVLKDFDFEELKASFFRMRPHLVGVYGAPADYEGPNYREDVRVFEPVVSYVGYQFLEHLESSGYIAEPEVVDTFELPDVYPCDEYWRDRAMGYKGPRDDSLVDALTDPEENMAEFRSECA
jgi:hypothetical protein